jgi:hypothetical protein
MKDYGKRHQTGHCLEKSEIIFHLRYRIDGQFIHITTN